MMRAHGCLVLCGFFLTAAPSLGQSFCQVDPGKILQQKGPPIFAAAFSKDGNLLATGGVDFTITLWDVAAGAKKRSWKGHAGPVSALAFSPDGKQLFSASFDKTVRIWNIADGSEAGKFDGFKLAVISLALSPDGKTLVAGTGQWNRIDLPEIRVIDLPQGKVAASLAVGNQVNKGSEPATLIFAPDGSKLAAAVRGNGLQAWNAVKAEKLITYYKQAGFPLSVSFSPDGLNVAAGYTMGQIVLLDAREWKELVKINGKGDVAAVSFSPDGRTLAAARRDGSVNLFDVSTLEVPEPITVRNGPLPATVALFAPAGKTLAAAGFDGQLVLHQVSRTAAPVAKVEPRVPANGSRVALVGTDRDPAVQTVLALAEAKLSSDVQLLDRRNIDAVLAEQKLSLAGFVNHEQIVRVGKLLGVDIFAIVEADKVNKQAVGLVVFNAQTGVRLWDATLPGAVNQGADAVAQAVRSSLTKHLKFGKDLATICLTTVRNADLPRADDALCDAVGQLLERGLVTSPDLALLERTRLEQVVKEQNLPTDSPLGQLLASLVRIELEVGKAADGAGLRGTALLFNNRNQQLGKVTATSGDRNPATLADALLGDVSRHLKVKVGTAIVDRIREVQRMNAEADFFAEHKDWQRSIKARQAACALKPDDTVIRAQLADNLAEAGRAVHRFLSARPVAFPDTTTSADYQRSLEYIHQGIVTLTEVERNRPEVGNELRYTASAWYNIVTYLDAIQFRKLEPATQELLERVQDANFILQEVRHDRAARQVRDKGSYEFYTTMLGDPPHRLYFARRAGLTDAQHQRLQARLLSRWLGFAEKFGEPPLSHAALRSTFSMLRELHDDTRARAYRQRLLRTDDLHVVLYDRQADFLLGFDKLPDAAKIERVETFRTFVQKFLDSEQARASAILRYNTYIAAVNGVNLLNNPNTEQARGHNLLELCRSMIDQKEFVAQLVQDTLHALFDGSGSRSADEKRLTLINQIMPLADSGRVLVFEPGLADPKYLANERMRLKSMLNEERRRIVSRFPDLERNVVQAWPGLQTLIDVIENRSGIVQLFEPVIHDGQIYVLGLGWSKVGKDAERYLELLRFSFAGGEPQPLGRLKLGVSNNFGSMPAAQKLLPRSDFITDACICEGYYAAGTKDMGILLFSLATAEAVRLDAAAGMPANFVQRLTCLNSKLYAALGTPGKEGYVIAHDVKTRRTEVLASSRRKDRQSPLDDTAPLQVLAFRADPERNRLLTYIWLGSFEVEKQNGLWQLDGKSGELKQLHQLSTASTSRFDLEWVSEVIDDRLVLALVDSTCRLDLATNKLERHRHPASSDRFNAFLEPRLPHLVRVLDPGERTLQLRGTDFFHKGWLYTAHPFGRVRLDGAEKEAFPSPRVKVAGAFRPAEKFVVVGNQVLMADQYGMWLGRLP